MQGHEFTLPSVQPWREGGFKVGGFAGNCTRRDAVRALVSHPWMTEIRLAEKVYDELAAAHHDYLPERLLR